MLEALGSLAGDFIGMEFNRKEASKNRAFQRDMSNTAYQRAMADMRMAGLNPILVGQVGGASTPTGSQASTSGVGKGIAEGSKAATQRTLAKTQKDLNVATAQQVGANTRKVNQEAEQAEIKTWLDKETIRKIQEDEGAKESFLLMNAANKVGVRPETMIPGALLDQLIQKLKQNTQGLFKTAEKKPTQTQKPTDLKQLEKELLDYLERDMKYGNTLKKDRKGNNYTPSMSENKRKMLEYYGR